MGGLRVFGGLVVVAAVATVALAVGSGAGADTDGRFVPGDLVVSRSVYDNHAANVKAGVTVLPPGCTSGCATATADGTYPFVWNNDVVDSSFGITSAIFLDQLTPSGALVNSLEVPAGSGHPGAKESADGRPKDWMVTSFSSKSELALNLSTDGQALTFMGYLAPVGNLDVSNSNTPGVVDPTNPVPGADYRVVAEVDRQGNFHFTKTNAYSGNNGRAAILNSQARAYYMAGNAGNGGNPQPDGVIIGAGAQIANREIRAETAQNPGLPTPVGSFNITQLGNPADKIGKDTNFRGLTIFDHVLYYTKGSGGNGVNTVYFLDTTGQACPGGVGLPDPNATLPSTPLPYNPSVVQTSGLQPTNMCILRGFPTALKTKTAFPFGVWFADPKTLYVADEGDGTNSYSAAAGTYTAAAAQKTAGLQKWILSAGTWKLAYTLQDGLDLGQPYSIPDYPAGKNPATGLPWAPATDGLRNLTGRVNPNGTVTIYAVTSTVSGNGDQGADPNKVVTITDDPAATAASTGESFTTFRAAGSGEVLRGVSFAPRSPQAEDGGDRKGKKD